MTESVNTRTPSNRQIAKVATGSIVGSIVEQYDFLVTGVIAGLVWGTLFFGPYGGIVGAISTYALGIMVRPIGATIFGHIADRVGRRDSMVYAIVLMGASTLIIGLVPVGVGLIDLIAVIIIIAMRIFQGISFGAEFGTASTWLNEYANKSKHRAFWSGWVAFAVPIGIVIATVAVLALELKQGLAFFESGSYLAGWRILFYIGFIVAIVGVVIRLTLDDSKLFEDFKRERKIIKHPSLRVWAELPKKVLVLSLVNGAFGALFFLVFVFGISYMTGIGFSSTSATEILIIGGVAMFFMMWFGTYLGDKYGRKLPVIVSLTLILMFAIPFFLMVDTLNFILASIAMIILFSAGFGIAYGSLPALYTEFFPTKYRASGASASYQFSQVYGGGLAPIIASFIFKSYPTVKAFPYIAGLTIVYITLGVLAMFAIKETKNIDLEKFETTTDEVMEEPMVSGGR